MNTKFYKNTKYNILTDEGFKHFDGLQVTVSNGITLVVTEVGHIYATSNHEFFYTKDDKKPIKEFAVGDTLFSTYGEVKILNLVEMDYSLKVYDVIDVEDCNTFLITADNIKVSNCCYIDEMAFIDNDVEFYTSTYPVITSGSKTKVIITSTPNGMNLFYKIWTDSVNGENEYKNYKVHWSEHPKRNQDWADIQIRQLGQAKFDVEFNSLSFETKVNIYANDKEEQLEIGDLYNSL